MKKYTPMMQQYLEIKKDYADAIVFFRLGDFYEMFFDDAIVASKVLEIALTSRGGAGERIPMCGIPYHAAKTYIQKLIEKGFKIAIAEQVTEPGKGLVEREVVRLITPGTVFEEGILDGYSHNFIANVLLTEKGYMISYIDLSTGEAFLIENLKKQEAFNHLKDLSVLEVILPSRFDETFINDLQNENILVSHNDNFELIDNKATRVLDLEQKRVASHLISYIVETQRHEISHLLPFNVLDLAEKMNVDYRVKSSLEIMTAISGNDKQTLFYVLNNTKTKMGTRLLKYITQNPITKREELLYRYNFIEALLPFEPRNDLLNALDNIYDLNRIIGRIAMDTVNARDLLQLKQSLLEVPNVKTTLMKYNNDIINDFAENINVFSDLVNYLEQSIHEEPPLTIKEGNIIKEGFNKELDRLLNISTHGNELLKEYEANEREKTGIKNLRVSYNRVFGYYIEISKGNIHNIKEEFGYDRKQTLINSERYTTNELKIIEDDIMSAKEKSEKLQYELFVKIREDVKAHIYDLQVLAKNIATIDAYLSLAVASEKNNYVKPTLNEDRTLEIVQGRHPVVEHYTRFVKNDCVMSDGEIFLITGPNMSGKSTYMRMIAVIIYMAQIGSFVPADKANLPIYDAIFTRIGSSDDISGGKSTFMVEMIESNEALSSATKNSLILFDELGRGTATYDGMALAQGIIEYIHEKIECHTLFSTHYHELTQLEMSLKRLKNYYVKAIEEKNKMIFLHHVEKGTIDKSYGIQVASLANLPNSLIQRSKQILQQLEQKDLKISLDLFNYDKYEDENYISSEQLKILDDIEAQNIDNLTPLDALLLLKHLQEILKKSR